MSMQNIAVGRYAYPEEHGWGGWVEPENREWILFVPLNSGDAPEFYKRDPVSGAVLDQERFEAPTAGSPAG